MATDWTPELYAELREIARSVIRDRRCPGLMQTTALVHEAWIRLQAREGPEQPLTREHLAGLAASAIRSIFIDEARREGADKRGGGWRRVSLSVDIPVPATGARWVDLVDLDAAIENLAALDERKARVVELRFFGGLTSEQAAGVLGVSTRTVETEWNLAKAWLRLKLNALAREGET